MWDYLINHARRTQSLNKQDSMESRAFFFFSWLKWKAYTNEASLEKIINSPSFAEVHVHSFLEVL